MISRTLGQTFQYTSAEDDALVERARKNGLKKVIEWDERNRRPKRSEKDKNKHLFDGARQQIKQLRKDHTLQDIADRYDVPITQINRLDKKRYQYVPISTARKINRDRYE
jgi:hypothetical protein